MGRYTLAVFSILLALAPGCPDEPEASAHWSQPLQGLDGGLFSVSGTSATDVWVAGADRGNGLGPTLLHWDGTTWTAQDTGLTSGNLLWVHVFADGTVVSAGSEGHIIKGSATTAFAPMTTPAERVVWGVWGATPDAMWAVGGLATGGTGFVWRYEGGAWSEVTLPAEITAPVAWFKVWGTAADNVYFCGADGAFMHWDGSALTAVDPGTTRTLLTVNGRADGSLVTAVGGQFSATLVASTNGGPFVDVTPGGTDPPLQMFGVYHRGNVAYAVGMQTTILRHDGTAWSPVDLGLDAYEDLHGVWIDPDGGVWAVGGQIVAPPYRSGALLYYGKAPPASEVGP